MRTSEGKTYVKDIHTAFVHEEALKEPLDDDQALAQEQHDGGRESTPMVKDEEEQVLWPEYCQKQERVDKEGDDGERNQAAVKQRVEGRMS